MRQAPLEKDFQKRVMGDLRRLPRSWFEKINDRATVGIPDVVGAINGYSVLIELKTKTKLSKIQHYKLEKADRAGCQSFVATPHNWAEIYQFLKSMLELQPPPVSQLFKPARIPQWCLPAQPRWAAPLVEPVLEPKAKWKSK
jgi:hypothetical protein